MRRETDNMRKMYAGALGANGVWCMVCSQKFTVCLAGAQTMCVCTCVLCESLLCVYVYVYLSMLYVIYNVWLYVCACCVCVNEYWNSFQIAFIFEVVSCYNPRSCIRHSSS